MVFLPGLRFGPATALSDRETLRACRFVKEAAWKALLQTANGTRMITESMEKKTMLPARFAIRAGFMGSTAMAKGRKKNSLMACKMNWTTALMNSIIRV